MDGVQLGFNYEEAVYFLIQGAIGILDMLQKNIKKKKDFQIGFYSVDSAYCFISRTN